MSNEHLSKLLTKLIDLGHERDRGYAERQNGDTVNGRVADKLVALLPEMIFASQALRASFPQKEEVDGYIDEKTGQFFSADIRDATGLTPVWFAPAQPTAPNAGERELIAAAQNVYDKLAGETTSVTIFDQERLGEALAAFKGGQ